MNGSSRGQANGERQEERADKEQTQKAAGRKGTCDARPALLLGVPPVLLAVDAVLLLHAPQLRLLLLQPQLLAVPLGVVVQDDQVAVLQAGAGGGESSGGGWVRVR